VRADGDGNLLLMVLCIDQKSIRIDQKIIRVDQKSIRYLKKATAFLANYVKIQESRTAIVLNKYVPCTSPAAPQLSDNCHEIWREMICNAGRRTCQIRLQTSQRRPCQVFGCIWSCAEPNIKSATISSSILHLSSFPVHHVWNIRILQLLEGKGVFISAYIRRLARRALAKSHHTVGATYNYSFPPSVI